MNDKEMLFDALSSQKQITAGYNQYAGECAHTDLRENMLQILNDEHCIQNTIFEEMRSRGHYTITQADSTQIQQAKQRLSSS